MLKIRRPLGRLIFNMGIAIPGKTVFLIETAPWILPWETLLSKIVGSECWYTQSNCSLLLQNTDCSWVHLKIYVSPSIEVMDKVKTQNYFVATRQIPPTRNYRNYKGNMWIFSDIASIPFLMADVFDYTDGITWFYASLIRNLVGSHSTTRSKIIKNDLYHLWK